MINKISTKFLVAFSIIFLFIAVQAAITINDLRYLRTRIDQIVLFSNEIDKVHMLKNSVLSQLMPANDYLITANKAEIALYKRQHSSTTAQLNSLHEFPLLTKEEQALLDRTSDKLQEIDSIARAIFAIEDPIGNQNGANLMEEMDTLGDEVVEILTKYYEIDKEELEEAILQTNQVYDRMFIMTVVFSLMVLSLTIILALYLSRLMVRPISALTAASRSLAKGKYEQIEIRPRKDELGILIDSFNSMSAQIKKNIQSIASFAREATVARERALKRADSISTIVMAGNEISSSININEIIANLLRNVVHLTEAGKAAVFLFNEELGALECVGCTGFSQLEETICGLSIKPDERTPISEAFMSGKYIFCEDPSVIAPGHKLLDIVKAEKLSGCISVPFKVRDEVLGVISVFNVKIVKYTEEEIDYLEILANNVASAIYNATLHDRILEAERKGQESELAIAQKIQSSLLPQSAPSIAGLEIGFFGKQARQVGGDFFDFIEVDNKLVVTIGDVSGKSVSAALLTSMIRYILRSTANSNNTLNPVTILNKALTEETTAEVFTTLLYLMLDVDKSKFHILNAGHIQPLFYSAEQSKLLYLEDTPQFPLGLRRNFEYEEQVFDFRPGDLLVLYTDGIVEARARKSAELFGYDQLFELVRQNIELPAQEMVGEITKNVIQFSAGELKDDLALIVIKAT